MLRSIFARGLLVAACMCLPGCANWFNLRSLSTDALDEGYASVVLLHLRVVDRTGRFGGRAVQVDFTSRREGTPTLDWVIVTGRDADAWKEKDGIQWYEALLIAQARPTEFQLADVGLVTGSEAMHIDLQKGNFRFVAGAGQVQHIGVLEAEVRPLARTDPQASMGLPLTVSYTLKQIPSQQAADLQAFQHQFPAMGRTLRSQPSNSR